MLNSPEKFDLIIDIENDMKILTRECQEISILVKRLSEIFEGHITVSDDPCPTEENLFSLNPEIEDDSEFLHETIRRLVEDEPLPNCVKKILNIQEDKREETESTVNNLTDTDPAKALDSACHMRSEINKLIHNIRTKSSQLNDNWTKKLKWSAYPDENAPEHYYFFEIEEESFKSPVFLKSLIRMYAKERRIPEDAEDYFSEVRGKKEARTLSEIHRTIGLQIRAGVLN